MVSFSRERLFGLERDCVVRSPRVGAPLSSRLNAGVFPPRTFFASGAPRVTKGPGIRSDVWAFRGQEGLTWEHRLHWPTTKVSVSVLFRLRTVATRQTLVASDDGIERAFSLVSLAGGVLRWQVHSGPTSFIQNSAAAYPPKFWRWITAICEPGLLKMYIDRTHSASVAGPMSWNSPTAPFSIGWRDEAGSEDRLDADVAWFAVWTRALSQTQVRELHRRPRPPRHDLAFSIQDGSFPPRRAFTPLALLSGPRFG